MRPQRSVHNLETVHRLTSTSLSKTYKNTEISMKFALKILGWIKLILRRLSKFGGGKTRYLAGKGTNL